MNAGNWKLVPGSYDFIKITIQQDLVIFNGWHVPFLIVLYSPLQKNKHWNLGIFGYWVIGAGCLIKKDLESSPSLPNCSNDYWKLLSLLLAYIYNWPILVASWFVFQKIYSKMHLVSCTHTHRDVFNLVNHGMIKNTKTWISWERNIIFLRNKKFLICALDGTF